MSKYRVIQAEFKSEPALRQALEDACGEFNIRYEYHAEGASLYGFQGDLRPERAELIIRRQYVGNMANDLGFARQADGSYAAIISEFDSTSRGQKKLDYITQRYAYHAFVNEAEMQGFSVYEQWLPDGSVELSLERAY